MKVPESLSPYVSGNSPTRLLQGLVVGVIATLALGFGWGDWHLKSTVDEKVEAAGQKAKVTALAPICAQKFKVAAAADKSLVPALQKVSSWQRDSYLQKGGWVTFAGGADPDSNVAEACVELLDKSLKLD